MLLSTHESLFIATHVRFEHHARLAYVLDRLHSGVTAFWPAAGGYSCSQEGTTAQTASYLHI